jgi:hypothetical protein
LEKFSSGDDTGHDLARGGSEHLVHFSCVSSHTRRQRSANPEKEIRAGTFRNDIYVRGMERWKHIFCKLFLSLF